MNNFLDFDPPISQKHPSSLKWSKSQGDCIAMGLADMDFATPSFVIDPINEYLKYANLGYYQIPINFYLAITNWYKNKLNKEISQDHIIAVSGIIPALKAMIHGFTKPGDKILIQEPVYHYFKKSILELSRVAVINQLEFINGSFEINFSLLESQLADHVKIFLLCSPHNPIGRIWKQEEILRIAQLCSKYNILLISDEIHSDLCMPNQFFYSICEIDPNIIGSWVLLNSPTKAFNFAGLRGGYVIMPNQHLKEKISTYIACFGVDKINALFPIATVSAYNDGSLWNKKITAYIYKNYLDVINSLKEYDHWLQVSRLQATYLVWINYSNMQISEQQLINSLFKYVIVEPGSIFGENGEYYFRINIACHNNLLKIALKRIIAVCTEIMQ